LADRQAVFKNDCAQCHVTPTVAKMGKELYQAGCAICHDAEHRATMVPDLHVPKVPTSPAYWTQWVTEGKAGSLMPAFAQEHGGPLNKEQIASLVNYLSTDFPHTNAVPVVTPVPVRAGS
jgi:mono/diheme cytochrome c family protein